MLLVHGHPLLQFPYGCNAKSNTNFEGGGKPKKSLKREKKKEKQEKKKKEKESLS
jgi:hypothetical protein